MKYTDYIKGISFLFYKPNNYPKGFNLWSRFLERFNLSLEALNTRLPDNARVMQNRLRELLKIPRMSTFAIGAMINEGVSQMINNSCFVNVGVWNGFTFLAGMINNPQKKCIGVDNFSQAGDPRKQFYKRFNKYKSSNHYFYDMNYMDYFSTIHKEQIGFYIYDGEHSYENQLKGLKVAEPFFSKNCITLVDDTNWDEPRQATLDFIAKSLNKYQILIDKKTFENSHPTLWNGIMVLQRIE